MDRLGIVAFQDSQVNPDLRERLVQPDLRVNKDFQVRLVREDNQDRMEVQDQPEPLDQPDPEGSLECKDLLEALALPVQQERTVHKGILDHLVI